ncbi:uncharacterized protein [Malus domestica]|uniref:uncharacterized protein isoform X1 n=1 Tax=Malus domestica TaxID=3750 RepID=UPI003974A884
MLEVGLGTGSLTNVLINAGAFVLAIKKDPYMATHVSERFAETDRLKVLKEDFVKCRIHSRVVVVGMCWIKLYLPQHKKKRKIDPWRLQFVGESLSPPTMSSTPNQILSIFLNSFHFSQFYPSLQILGFPQKSLISSSIVRLGADFLSSFNSKLGYFLNFRNFIIFLSNFMKFNV